MTRNLRLLLSTVALASALSAVACGARAAEQSPADLADNPPVVAPATPATPDAPEPAVPVSIPATPDVVEEPAAIPAPAESPRILWIRSSHAGPGVVTLRFETNVPTTAQVTVPQGEVGPATIYTEQLDELATTHETSVPANAIGRYVVHAQDAQGNAAWGTLRLSDQYGLDWGVESTAPSLKVPDAKHFIVKWGFASNHPSHMGLDGELLVFATPAGCTTADSCVGEQVAEIDAPAGPGVKVETHEATATIAGSANDYQIVIAQPLNLEASSMIFFQMEVKGFQLPKTNFPGTGTIKSN